jgi:hypothetical protein
VCVHWLTFSRWRRDLRYHVVPAQRH